MKPSKKPFRFHSMQPCWSLSPLSSKGNSCILTYMCLLTIYPIAIPMHDKSSETVIQAYLKHVYATVRCSLMMITNNGKQFKNELFQRVAEELNIKQIFKPIPSTIKGYPGKIPLLPECLHNETYTWKIRLGRNHTTFTPVLGYSLASILKRVHSSFFSVQTHKLLSGNFFQLKSDTSELKEVILTSKQ